MIKHAPNFDEIWHAGDWGDFTVASDLEKLKSLKGVYGNIDGREIRKRFPEDLIFTIEGIKVYITHIGGYPGRYAKGIKSKLKEEDVDLFITGHSHICKVMKDKELDLLHINPGAMGNTGFHKKKTMISFSIDDGNIFDVTLYEYDRTYD